MHILNVDKLNQPSSKTNKFDRFVDLKFHENIIIRRTLQDFFSFKSLLYQNYDLYLLKYENSIWIIAGIFSVLKLNHVIYALIGDGFGQMVL